MSSSQAVASFSPAAGNERLPALDILRGLALLGMVLVHFHQRVEQPAPGIEDLVGWIIWVGVEQKSWGTFALLFGSGFAILLRRLDARGVNVAPFYLRRLAVLALFGIIAEAAFGFQILLDYAIWGVPLVFIRRWSDRTLLAVAIAAVSVRPLLMVVDTLWRSPGSAQSLRPLFEAVRNAEQHGQYLTLLTSRLALMAAKMSQWRHYLPDVNLALFLVGLLAVRRGVFDEPRRHVRLIAGWMIFGAASWAAWWLVLRQVPVANPRLAWPAQSLLGLVQEQWLCLTYVGAIVLLLAYRPEWENRLKLFAFAGSMALTNYIAQAAALDFLSSNYGLALKLRPYWIVAAAAILFLGEALVSRWWLLRYRFGPLEWIWRSLTYGRAQSIARTPLIAPASA